jgi:tetratricopeptide (TPR) repeat protein
MILSMRVLAVLAIFASSMFFAGASETAYIGENLIETARRELQKENYAAANAALDQFERSKGPSAISHDVRGCIEMEQGNFSAAAKAFEAAQSADPSLFSVRLHVGDLLLRQKQYAQARGIYETLLKETNILFLNERLRYAVLFTYLGERDENGAEAAFKKITFPTESPAYYYGQAAWAFAHGKDREAEDWLKSAAKIYKSEMVPWFARPLYDFGWIKNKPPPSDTHA